MSQFQSIQLEWLLSIQENMQSSFNDRFFAFITSLADKGWMWIVIAFIVLAIGIVKMKKEGDKDIQYLLPGITMGVALLLSFLFTNLLLKHLFNAPRPYILYDYDILVDDPPGTSFPSGHSSISFAGAVSLFMYYRKTGIAALILAGMIAFSRMYLFVHFPIDVIVGSIVGCLYGIIAYGVVKKFYERYVSKNQLKIKNIED